jgi:hypothetical protein
MLIRDLGMETSPSNKAYNHNHIQELFSNERDLQNYFKIPKGLLEAVNRRRTYNAMAV